MMNFRAPRQFTRPIALAWILIACGGKPAPDTSADPARGLRKLTDTEVSEIAVAAAQSLPPSGSVTSHFSGVFIDGQQARMASEAVVRATGFVAVEGRTTPPSPPCRVRNVATGATTPVPCPPSAATALPPTWSFVAVRATNDSAYVGSSKAESGRAEPGCITLARAGARWRVVSTLPMADARRCGR
jgi:hypothetical protein